MERVDENSKKRAKTGLSRSSGGAWAQKDHGNDMHGSKSMPKKRQPRKPKVITATYLANSALYYLQRYASSTANLRRVMRAKILRSAKFHDTDAAAGLQLLEDLIVRYEASGLLNDTLYTETKVRGLRHSGTSKRRIQQKLQQKGVAADLVNDVVDATDAAEDTDELQAAMIYARRKKLGPYRTRMIENAQVKDLASMARAGYSYQIIKQIMDAEAMGDSDFE